MLPRSKKGTAIPFRWNRHEADDKGADSLFYAGGGYVCFQGDFGICAEYSFAWRIYDCVYGRIPQKGIVSDLYLCAVKWDAFWIFGMVGSVFVHLDCTLGRCDAAAQADAASCTACRIYGSLRGAWVFVWDAVCAGAGDHVWA
mgnify:CR=1 FL=1